ncbi:MAG: hypothetical protein JSR33_05975 [Proteobacteria bacterium]|nr:hypothetical protein [Pseudomonadota bacterium]
MQILPNFSMIISALWQDRVFRDAENFYPTHMISLVDPEYSPSTLLTTFTKNYLLISAKDRTEAYDNSIPESIIFELVKFLDETTSSSKQSSIRLLIHCHLGISRSPAIGYVALSRLFGYGLEEKAFSTLLMLTNKPWPNHGIISTVDRLLNYNNSLLTPLENYRKKWPLRHQAYRRLNKKLNRIPGSLKNEKK